MMDHLSEEGFWKYKNAVRVEVLSMTLAALDVCKDLDTAKDVIKKIHDSYVMASWPGVRDESTDHLL